MLNLIALVAVAATAGPATVKSGVERWRAGDHAGAVAAWLPYAAQGDPDAMFNLGQAYKLGRGVTKDQNIARDYYRKAAAKGHLPAQANLGIALFQAGDKAEAVRWLQTAADRGEPRAQYVFGIAAYNGDGTPKNQGLAYGYLLRAKASGLAQAATALTSIEPQLSAEARTAGTAMAASMAAGTGVPAALAAARPVGGVLRPAPAPTQVATTTLPPRSTLPATLPVPSPVIAPRLPVPAPVNALRPPDQVATTPASPDFPTPTPPVRSAPVATADATPKPVPVVTTTVPVPRPAPVVTTPVSAPTPRPTAIAAAPSPAQVVAARPDNPVKPPVSIASRPKDWRVQLGAFSSKKLADEAWASVRKSQSTAIGDAKPIFDTSGPVVKFQLGPYKTRTAASDICAKLAFAGRACFVTQG